MGGQKKMSCNILVIENGIDVSDRVFIDGKGNYFLKKENEEH